MPNIEISVAHSSISAHWTAKPFKLHQFDFSFTFPAAFTIFQILLWPHFAQPTIASFGWNTGDRSKAIKINIRRQQVDQGAGQLWIVFYSILNFLFCPPTCYHFFCLEWIRRSSSFELVPNLSRTQTSALSARMKKLKKLKKFKILKRTSFIIFSFLELWHRSQKQKLSGSSETKISQFLRNASPILHRCLTGKTSICKKWCKCICW